MILSILQGKIISWQDGDTSVYVGCKEPLLDLCFFFPLHFTCSRSVSAKRVFWNKSVENERRELRSPNFWLLTHNSDLDISLFIFHLPQQLQNICVLYLSEKKCQCFLLLFGILKNVHLIPHYHIVEVKNMNCQWHSRHRLSTSLAVSISISIITLQDQHQHQHLARSWRVQASTSFPRSTFFPTKCFTHPRLPHCIIHMGQEELPKENKYKIGIEVEPFLELFVVPFRVSS